MSIGIERVFSSEETLQDWLEEKRWACGSAENFFKWITVFYEEGNRITVNGSAVTKEMCTEMTKWMA